MPKKMPYDRIAYCNFHNLGQNSLTYKNNHYDK